MSFKSCCTFAWEAIAYRYETAPSVLAGNAGTWTDCKIKRNLLLSHQVSIYEKEPNVANMQKGIQHSLGFWIPFHGFRILDTRFRILCLTVKLKFRNPWVVFRIPTKQKRDLESRLRQTANVNLQLNLYHVTNFSRFSRFLLVTFTQLLIISCHGYQEKLFWSVFTCLFSIVRNSQLESDVFRLPSTQL